MQQSGKRLGPGVYTWKQGGFPIPPADPVCGDQLLCMGLVGHFLMVRFPNGAPFCAPLCWGASALLRCGSCFWQMRSGWRFLLRRGLLCWGCILSVEIRKAYDYGRDESSGGCFIIGSYENQSHKNVDEIKGFLHPAHVFLRRCMFSGIVQYAEGSFNRVQRGTPVHDRKI